MDQTDAEPERRRDPRVSAAIDVEIDVYRQDRLIHGHSENLSLGGVCVRAPETAAEGEDVLIVLSADDRVVISLGTVLGSTIDLESGQLETRLRFRHLTGPRRENLARLLGQLSG
jgi:c-di-GMP-binding flagellar brake protein YcgR